LDALYALELFFRVGRKLSKRLSDGIYQRQGLSNAEVQVLWTVHNKQVCRVSELSDTVGISPSTTTGIIDRLMAKGLLERMQDPDDRRGIILKSVSATAVMIEHLKATLDEEMYHILSVLPEGREQDRIEDLQQILNYLEQEKR